MKSKIKTALFDADGVIIVPKKLFSSQYAKKHGLNEGDFQKFFDDEFSRAMIGKSDLKDLIRKHHDTWQWDKDPQELLDMWFDAENVTDKELLNIINCKRSEGLPVYIATNQERYRSQYLKDVVFSNVFDDVFVSCEIGYMKKDPQYWVAVLGKLQDDVPNIKPEEIVFFDDSQDSVDGAARAGIRAYLYEGVEQVKKVFKVD